MKTQHKHSEFSLNNSEVERMTRNEKTSENISIKEKHDFNTNKQTNAKIEMVLLELFSILALQVVI